MSDTRLTPTKSVPLPMRIPPLRVLLTRARLVSGLILLAFALTHFLGHGLGNISLDALTWGQEVRWVIWQSIAGTIALYGALLIHVALAVTKTVSRRTFKLPAAEWAQLILGLLIPVFLIDHVLHTRVAKEVAGVEDTYRHVLDLMWPGSFLEQTTLMLLVWIHAMIGMDYWLRHRRWYIPLRGWLLVLAATVPVFATTGWTNAAKEYVLTNQARSYFAPGQREKIDDIATVANAVSLGVLGFVVIYPLGAAAVRRMRSRLRITYLGDRTVRSAPGATLLEVSRENAIPHMAVCGGRARCSTCRVRVVEGLEDLLPASSTEQAVLAHVKAGDDVRLACQITPKQNLSVVRLVKPRIDTAEALDPSADYRWGVEQPVIVMFTDLRGFTRFSEKHLPYDVVFVLNAYLESSAELIARNHGVVDKFMGDGIMALFGVGRSFEAAAWDALTAAVALQDGMDQLNQELTQHIDEPLRLAIALNGGPAILGRIGHSGGDGPLTALGGTVNTASRLEGIVKQKDAKIVASRNVIRAARLNIDSVGTVDQVPIRGREETEQIAVIHDHLMLKSALTGAAPDPAARQIA